MPYEILFLTVNTNALSLLRLKGASRFVLVMEDVSGKKILLKARL